MRVGLRFERQTIYFAFREHWKVHEGGADLVRELCSQFFHKLKCYGHGIGNDHDNVDTYD